MKAVLFVASILAVSCAGVLPSTIKKAVTDQTIKADVTTSAPVKDRCPGYLDPDIGVDDVENNGSSLEFSLSPQSVKNKKVFVRSAPGQQSDVKVNPSDSSEITISQKSEEGQYTVLAYDETGAAVSRDLYVVSDKTSGRLFYSYNSISDAKSNAISYAAISGLITTDAGLDQLSTLYSSSVSSTVTADVGYDYDEYYDYTLLTGFVTFQDRKGKRVPVAGINVEVWEDDVFNRYLLTSTQTDRYGLFSLRYYKNNIIFREEYGSNPFLVFYASNDNLRVTNAGGQIYSYRTDSQFGVPAGIHLSYTINLPVTTAVGRAFEIFEAAYYASLYGAVLNNNTPLSTCTIRYPSDDPALGPCSSYYTNGVIEMSGTEMPSIRNNILSYESWDTVCHEYGHHVEKALRIFNDVGGPHTSGQNLEDAYLYNLTHNADGTSNGYTLTSTDFMAAVYNGTRLAWNEGWATYFAVMCQLYDINYKPKSTVPWICDNRYTAANGVDVCLETGTSSSTVYCTKGYGSEDVVASLLYNLTDSNNDSIDVFSYSPYTLSSLANYYCVTNLSAFLNRLYLTGVNKSNLGLLLQAYCIAPKFAYYTGGSATVAPYFAWALNGGSSYASLSNDTVDLVFYDANGAYLYTIYDIMSSYYQMSLSTWTTILHKCTTHTLSILAGGSSERYSANGLSYSTALVMTNPLVAA